VALSSAAAAAAAAARGAFSSAVMREKLAGIIKNALRPYFKSKKITSKVRSTRFTACATGLT
jgi:hypothetical protein